MTFTGKSFYTKLQSSLQDVEAELGALNKKLYATEQDISTLAEQSEGYLVKLTRIFLPEMTAQAISTSLKEVRETAQTYFAEKQKRRQELDVSLQASQTKKKTLEGQMETVTDQLNQKVAERRTLKEAVAKDLAANQTYTTLYPQAQEAKQRLDQYAQRLEEAKQEASQKIPAFEQNILFMYLFRRNFIPVSSHRAGIIQRLDAWVARVVNYAEARKNYEFLNTMPDLMQLEVQRQQDTFAPLLAQLKAVETEAADRHGLTAVMEEGKKLGVARANLLKTIEEIAGEFEAHTKERQALDNTKGDYHKAALGKLKERLKAQDLADLKRMARQHPGTEDDRLVDAIEEADLKIRALKDTAKDIKKDQHETEKKLQRLEDLRQDYTSHHYDSGRSRFDNDFDSDALLLGYMLGQSSRTEVWHTIEHHHSFEPEPSYTPSHSSRSSDDDGPSWSIPSSPSSDDDGPSWSIPSLPLGGGGGDSDDGGGGGGFFSDSGESIDIGGGDGGGGSFSDGDSF